MDDYLKLIDPSYLNNKRVVVIGAGNLDVPLLIDALFSPKSIDAIDTDAWAKDYQQIKHNAFNARGTINLYPLADFSLQELISTGATPWDFIFSNIYFEESANPFELLEKMSLLTTNCLLVYTHTSIESALPVITKDIYADSPDYAGISWKMSEKSIDVCMQYIGFYKSFDLIEIKRSTMKKTHKSFSSLKSFYRIYCLNTFAFLFKIINSLLYIALKILTFGKISTPRRIDLIKTLRKPDAYYKLWTKI